jgi:hypothetical protein
VTNRATGVVDLVHHPLTPAQEQLLQLLADTFLRERLWPKWWWLRRQLQELGLDPEGEQLLLGLPRLGIREGLLGQVYGYLWFSDWIDGSSLGDESMVGLTMVGFWRTQARSLVTEYLIVLNAAARASRDFERSLTEVTRPVFSSSDVADLGPRTALIAALPLADSLRHEPPFQASGPVPSADGLSWSCRLNDTIDSYQAVTSVGDYVQTVTLQLAKANTELVTRGWISTPAVQLPRWKQAGRKLLTSGRSGTGTAVRKLWENAVTTLVLAVAGLVVTGAGAWILWVKDLFG